MRLLILWRRLRKLLGLRSCITDIYGKPFPLSHAQGCVGKGWSPLVKEAYDLLLDGACITQVKEKFGGLRFYYEDVVDHPEIDAIEERSFEVCEDCGSGGQIHRLGGWMLTLCASCAETEGATCD